DRRAHARAGAGDDSRRPKAGAGAAAADAPVWTPLRAGDAARALAHAPGTGRPDRHDALHRQPHTVAVDCRRCSRHTGATADHPRPRTPRTSGQRRRLTAHGAVIDRSAPAPVRSETAATAAGGRAGGAAAAVRRGWPRDRRTTP